MKSNILRDNIIFWSRLGIGIGYKALDESGNPVIEDDTFSALRYHRRLYEKGVRIHSFILEAGWTGDGVYNFTTTDRTMDAACRIGDDALLIPRIKFDPPDEWLKNNPEEVFVYYDGPDNPDEISAMVGTDKHDYLGYDAPEGLYMGNPKYARPNVGGKISNQSFSSDKWLEAAEVTISKLITHLEEKYGDRILGYHIAFGTSGETLMWGRISQKYGDYGITNRRKFNEFLEKNYGITAEMGSPDSRYKQNGTLSEFMRADNPVARYYDEFMDEVNSHAAEFLCKAVKKYAPDKLTGVFYGYYMGIAESGYTGHTNVQKLLDSPYVDFFAAPKIYYRMAPGDSCGEYGNAQSVNMKKIWVDECDIRTHLAKDTPPQWACNNIKQTRNSFTRELAKNMSHDSGLWFMDLGGGWYDSEEIIKLVEELNDINNNVRKKKHESVADVLILINEKSTSVTSISFKSLQSYAVDLICDIKRTGAIPDIYRCSDVKDLDLNRYKLIIYAYDFSLSDEDVRYVCSHSDATVMFQYAAGCLSGGNFSLDNTKNTTGFSLYELPDSPFDFPCVKVKGDSVFECENGNTVIETRNGRSFIMNTYPTLPIEFLKKIVTDAGCRIYCEADYTIYGDNRFLAVIASDKDYNGKIDFGQIRKWRCVTTGECGEGRCAFVSMDAYDVRVFLFEC